MFNSIYYSLGWCVRFCVSAAVGIARKLGTGAMVNKIETIVIPSEAESAEADVPKKLSDRVERSSGGKKKSYVLDLRIHSPASLGYMAIEGIDTAPALVRLAKVKGLDVIAVTDFYSADFIDRINLAAKDSALTVIPGTVIRCAIDGCDDVVISCLFPEGTTRSGVEAFLKAIEAPESAKGSKKFIVKKPFAEVLSLIETYGGVAIPSRMDKTPHRMGAIATLVEQYKFRAFDLAYPDSSRYFKQRWPKTKFQFFTFSNANALAQVGSRIAKVKMDVPGFAGIKGMVGRAADA